MIWFLSNLFFQGTCLLAWYLNRHRLPAWSSYPVMMVFITMLTESVAAYYWLVLRQNNIFLFHGLVPIQYTFLILPYRLVSTDQRIRTGILLSILLIYTAEVLFALSVQPVTVYNTYTQLLAYSFLTLWTAIYLWNLLNDHDHERISTNPMFWMSAGIMFYAVSSFVITGMLNYLIHYAYSWATILYYFTTIITFILYVIFTLTFYSPYLFNRRHASD